MKIKASKGFTIIEMIIVIAVIGILTGIGLVHYQNIRELARDARRKSDASYIRLALALYNDDYGSYPMPVANSGAGPDISVPMSPATTIPDGTIFSKTENPLYPDYMSGAFVDSVNDSENYYVYDTRKNDYRDYVFCIHQESKKTEAQSWTAFYASGGVVNIPSCPNLP